MFNQLYGVHITPQDATSYQYPWRQTHTHMRTYTHTNDPHRINFKKPGAPGLKTRYILYSTNFWWEKTYVCELVILSFW